MTGKLKMLIGVGVGYVLGARAGRGRYEQIANQAQRFMHDPRVQHQAGQAKDLATEKPAAARDVAAAKAGAAVEATKEKGPDREGGVWGKSGSGRVDHGGRPSDNKKT